MGTFIYGIGKDVKDVANAKIIEQKATVVSEIKDKFEKAKSVVLFDYRGLSVSEVTELRKKLRESGADYKVYKNTLTKRALDQLNIDMNDYLEGPSAVSFGTDELSIVKVLNDFARLPKYIDSIIDVLPTPFLPIIILRFEKLSKIFFL